MSLRANPFVAGKLRGTVYTFEKVGDTIPLHKHGPVDAHIMIVARGPVALSGPVIGSTDHDAGAVVDIPSGVEHEIVARVDNARVVNIQKG